jgi:transposase
MANQHKVEMQNAIKALKTKGWSQRRIARELGIDRETVARYWEPLLPANPAISIPGDPPAEPNPAISTPGVCGRKSLCEELAAPIRAKVEAGLTAQRIYQDLKLEAGFIGSYQAVKRFVRKLKRTLPLQVWRVEVQPGEEAQVDFGLAAPLVDAQGHRRRTWFFRLVLSYSRKGYTEAVLRQDTETFIRCLENAFRALGGVPRTLNLDNLKAAVLKADWADPDLNPKLAAFCRHYGTILLPCIPRTPHHKGKCENNVHYVKSNALANRTFSALAEENQHLAQWERTVADVRIHGTTRQQVAQRFAQEQPALLPLPPSLFPVFNEAQRTVHRDSYVEVAKAYYAVPPEYIGLVLWVRWDAREVRVFNARWEQLCLHVRLEPGRFSKVLGIGGGPGTLQANLTYWLGRAQALGTDCAHWAQTLVQQRGVAGMRALMGLVNLISHHSYKALNTACAKAQAQ